MFIYHSPCVSLFTCDFSYSCAVQQLPTDHARGPSAIVELLYCQRWLNVVGMTGVICVYHINE